MTRHYTETDLVVTIIATMLGCTPGSGLVNTLNALSADGLIEDGDTYGWILKQVCERELVRLGDVSRKPVDTRAA